MLIPTIVVRYKGGNGDDVIINASDFDAEKHEKVEAGKPKGGGKPKDLTPGPISSVNGDKAAELIAAATTAEELDQLEDDERASKRHEGGRKGVLEAIAARRDELEG
jgi:hypothetical protein